MCGCNKVIPQYQGSPTYIPVITPPVFCTKTLGDIQEISNKLPCLKSKINIKQYNSFVGIIQSMLNLQDYCKYDTDQITQMLTLHGC